MKPLAAIIIVLGVIFHCQESPCQFGSVPISKSPAVTKPAAPASAPAVAPAPPAVSAPAATLAAPSAQPMIPQSSVPGKKWLQHESGYVILVDSGQAPGTGFKEVSAPIQPPSAPSPPSTMATSSYSQPMQPPPPQYSPPTQPAPPAGQSFSNPAFTQSGAYQAPAAMQQPMQQPMQSYQPNPYQQPAPQTAASGTPPGKKWMQHKSGYRVIVDQSTQPGPEFVEIPAPNSPPAGMAMQQPYPQQYQQAPQAQPYAQTYAPPQGSAAPQTYSQIPMQGGGQMSTAPQAYQPQLSSLPPNMQRSLPYQPPTPPGVPPPQIQYQQPAMGQPGAKPAVRSAPPGKKWVQQEGGMRYLVDVSTIPGPGFKELTDEEASKPIMIYPQGQQPQQQQQQQKPGFLSGLFGGGR